MADRMLTTSEVTDSRIAGIPWPTLAGWITKGVITPTVPGGKGRGNSARFSVMQAVGVAVAAELCRQPQGCLPAYVASIVAAFGAMPVKKLLKSFADDGTHFVMISAAGIPVLRGKAYDWIDVKEIYDRILEVAKS